MRILLIHGRAQGGKNQDELKAFWIEALKEGFRQAGVVLPHIPIDFPYYGEDLDRFSEQANLPLAEDVIRKGSGQNNEFEVYLKSAILQMAQEGPIKIHESGISEVRTKDPQNWWWVREIARRIDTYWTVASSYTIERYLRDVYIYLTYPAVTKAINEIVLKQLTREDTIIVAHSLGSVVGYNILTKHNINNVRKYLTVGSPLGIRAVSGMLGVPQNPLGQNCWYNAFDRRDIIALYPLDQEHFPTRPSIINNPAVDNDTSNRHGITGYLKDKSVALQMSTALEQVEVRGTPPGLRQTAL